MSPVIKIVRQSKITNIKDIAYVNIVKINIHPIPKIRTYDGI